MKDRYYISATSKEIERQRQIAMVIHKLKKGIALTSTEYKFIKQNSPVYYNAALKQGNIYRNKK